MQLRMSTRTVEGVLVVDCSGRIVFGEERATWSASGSCSAKVPK
jgi:hypothetical protein